VWVFVCVHRTEDETLCYCKYAGECVCVCACVCACVCVCVRACECVFAKNRSCDSLLLQVCISSVTKESSWEHLLDNYFCFRAICIICTVHIIHIIYDE